MLYDHPKYYEVAFSFRDISAEAAFMQTGIERHSRIPVHSLLEIGCGPAPHAEELARRGYRYMGLDLNRTMLDYAADKWRHLHPAPSLIESDMTDFSLDSQVDFAFVMIGSLYLRSESHLRSHFDAIAKALRPGALYFLDWCIQFFDPTAWDDKLVFQVEENGIAVRSQIRVRPVESAGNLFEEFWTVDVDDHRRPERFEMVERNMALYPREFREFIDRRKDFEFVGRWADWDLDRFIHDGTNIDRPLVIVRRTAGSTP